MWHKTTSVFIELVRMHKFCLKCFWSLKDSTIQISENVITNQFMSARKVCVQNERIQNVLFSAAITIKHRANYVWNIESLYLHPFSLRYVNIPVSLIVLNRSSFTWLFNPCFFISWDRRLFQEFLLFSLDHTGECICSVMLFPRVLLVSPVWASWRYEVVGIFSLT